VLPYLMKNSHIFLDCMVLKVEVISSSEMNYQSTWYNVSEDSDHQHCCEDTKSRIYNGHLQCVREVAVHL
jgi:hypothetical protein